MAVNRSVKTVITIILLLLTFISPLIGLVGVLVMWFWTTWKKWVKILITVPIALLVVLMILSGFALFTYMFLFKPFQMVGQSMAPTYNNGAYLITNVYDSQKSVINRGDIIVFKAPTYPQKDFLKRVVALPGETVMTQNGDVYVASQKLDENQYIAVSVKTFPGAFLKDGQSVTVPTGQYFVLGDNRPYSSDSREWGFVPQANIISKVSSCYWNCK